MRHLPAALQDSLARLRARRGFAVDIDLEARLALLTTYFARTGVDAAVVGVSGGVDSAVVAALLGRVRRQPGSPLVKVVAALLPVDVEAGVTGQARATARGRLAAEAAGVDVVTVPLADAHAATLQALTTATSTTPTAFSAGQLVSTIRTPALYGLATLLSQQGTRAVVVGTTNRDEGGFLGFFGKASDGMVDVQPIADLHKSEVRALARRLGVPDEIVDAVPTGDTFDGRVDEDMIGASYDAVELIGLWRAADDDVRTALSADWSSSTRAGLTALCQLLDERHAQNAHKYVGGSPAVCLDVWPRAIPGGWRDEHDRAAWREAPADAAARFVGLTSSPTLPASAPWRTRAQARPVPGTAGQAIIVDDVLDAATCCLLADAALAAVRVPVDEHGRPSPSPASSSSSRLSWWDPALAERLWERLREALPPVRVVHPGDAVDSGETGECGDEQPVWRPVGVSPYLRVLVGGPGQWLVPHVDTAFDVGDGLHRTLQSVLVALEVPDGDGAIDPGGRTRFLVDPWRHLPVVERPIVDETAPAADHRVLAAVTHRTGGALVFDHRLLHEQERFVGPGRRVLVRTDIVFRRCAPRAFLPPSTTPLPVTMTSTTTMTAASTAAARQAALIRKDPFYRTLASDEAALCAGFFDDAGPIARDAIEDDAALLATPLHKVARALRALDGARDSDTDAREARPRVVLVAAGALSPVHAGHLEMMARARAGLEARGAVVVGGFLAPDHDAYVLHKTPSSPSAARRVELAEAAVADSDWLAVDAWPALVATRALNFTEVVEHLAATLSRWLPSSRPLRVVFVCGGDNARFAHAFARRGHVVVVARRGADDVFVAEQERARADPAMRVAMAHGRVAFVDDAPVPASSSAIRAGDTTHLPAAVRARLAASRSPSSSSTRYELRDEGRFAVAPWLAGRDEANVLQAWRRFVDDVAAAFGAALPGVDVVVTSAAAQAIEVRARLATQPGLPVVSLDPCTPGDHDLAVSRCFHLGGDDEAPVIVARPGSPELAMQLGRLPAGPVLLLDDDIASGATVRAVQTALPATTRVVEVMPMSTASVLDRLDVRDLLPGAREAGLVVRLPDGAIARVPYLWPWVRLSRRASVDVDVERSLSRRLLERALTFFRAVEPALVVADADPAQRVWLTRAGFCSTTTLADVCAWHLDRLPGGGR